MVKKSHGATGAGLGPEELLFEACGAVELGLILYDQEDRLLTCNARYLKFYDKLSEPLVLGTGFEDIIRTNAR